MGDIDLGEEDGFITVTFGGASLRLDLYDTNDKLVPCLKSGDDEGQGKALIALMGRLGFPEPSRRVAVRFANAVIAAVNEDSKKNSGSAAAPSSTASTPAP